MATKDGELKMHMSDLVRPKRRFTKQDVAGVIDNMCHDLRAVREAGQAEYAHADDTPFRNFETLAGELSMDRQEVLWIYLRKHMDGILAHIRGHKSQRENVSGRIKDAIMYLMILHAMNLEEDTP